MEQTILTMQVFLISEQPCSEVWVVVVVAVVAGSRDGITTSANIGSNFSKEFTKKFKLGGNVRYGYGDTEVISDVFTQNILSAGNTLESESNRTNNISQNFHIDLRMEWKPDTSTTIIFRPDFSL